MNLPTHMSGQFSGQVTNQSGTSLSAVPHQQNIMQSSGGQRSTLNVEPGFMNARRYIQDKIYDFLMRRQNTQEVDSKKVMDIVRRLEEGLFKTATTKEEYMNIETLETRLDVLIKRLPLNNHNQQYQQRGNTSVPMGTMIPNPGMPQSGNSSIMVPSSRHTMAPSAVNTEDIEVDNSLNYVEEPVAIIDIKEMKLWNKVIKQVRVQWRHRKGSESTWESEEEMKELYPQLFP